MQKLRRTAQSKMQIKDEAMLAVYYNRNCAFLVDKENHMIQWPLSTSIYSKAEALPTCAVEPKLKRNKSL